MYNILFVCTANICRTPIAKFYLRHLLTDDGLASHYSVNSAGTWAMAGQTAEPNSILVCKEHDLSCTNHKATPITTTEMNQADLILCMGKEHHQDLSSIFPHFKNKIYVLTDYGLDGVIPKMRSIKDPYGRNLAFYRNVYRDICDEIDRIYPILRTHGEQKIRLAAN